MRSYIVKENHKSSAVSEILQYRQTQILLFLFKDSKWFKFAKNPIAACILYEHIWENLSVSGQCVKFD